MRAPPAAAIAATALLLAGALAGCASPDELFGNQCWPVQFATWQDPALARQAEAEASKPQARRAPVWTTASRHDLADPTLLEAGFGEVALHSLTWSDGGATVRVTPRDPARSASLSVLIDWPPGTSEGEKAARASALLGRLLEAPPAGEGDFTGAPYHHWTVANASFMPLPLAGLPQASWRGGHNPSPMFVTYRAAQEDLTLEVSPDSWTWRTHPAGPEITDLHVDRLGHSAIQVAADDGPDQARALARRTLAAANVTSDLPAFTLEPGSWCT